MIPMRKKTSVTIDSTIYNTVTCKKKKSWKKQQMPLTTKRIPDHNEMQNSVNVHYTVRNK